MMTMLPVYLAPIAAGASALASVTTPAMGPVSPIYYNAFQRGGRTPFATLTDLDPRENLRLHPYFPKTPPITDDEVMAARMSDMVFPLADEAFQWERSSPFRFPAEVSLPLLLLERTFGSAEDLVLTRAMFSNPSFHYQAFPPKQRIRQILEVLESLTLYFGVLGMPKDGIKQDRFLRRWFDPRFDIDGKKGKTPSFVRPDQTDHGTLPLNGYIIEFREQVRAFLEFPHFIAYPHRRVINTSTQGHIERYEIDPDGIYTKTVDGEDVVVLFEVKSFGDQVRGDILRHHRFRLATTDDKRWKRKGKRGRLIDQFLRSAHAMSDPANRHLYYHLHLVTSCNIFPRRVREHLEKAMRLENEHVQAERRNSFQIYSKRPFYFSDTIRKDVLARVIVTSAPYEMDLEHLRRSR